MVPKRRGPEQPPRRPQLISSKVPKAEYLPTIIRRDDPSIIPILYVSAAQLAAGRGARAGCQGRGGPLTRSGFCLSQDHEHATFEDILGTCPQPGGGSWGGAADKRWGPRGSAHTLSSPEEIEKKLNVYHKGAKIWKLLIFCQVGLCPSGPGAGLEDGASPALGMCAPRGSSGWSLWCEAPSSQPQPLTGRPGTPVPAQE